MEESEALATRVHLRLGRVASEDAKEEGPGRSRRSWPTSRASDRGTTARIGDTMDLGLQLGCWGQLPPPDWVGAAVEAERLGFNSVWTAEGVGSPTPSSPLAYLAALTERVQLGTSVVQLAACADRDGDVGDHDRPCPAVGSVSSSACQAPRWSRAGTAARRTSRWRHPEYVEIIRRVVAREEPLDFQGEFHQHPYHGEVGPGLGKSLKSIVHRCGGGSRSTWAPRAQERDADRGDRGRLVAAVLLAVPPGRVRRPARRRPGQVPGRGAGVVPGCRRRRARHHRERPGRRPGDAGVLHRRHGRQGPELPHQAGGPDGPRRTGQTHPGPVPGGTGRRGGLRGAGRVRRRDQPGRHPGASPIGSRHGRTPR